MEISPLIPLRCGRREICEARRIIIDISNNTTFLMVALENKVRYFVEDGSSNFEVVLSKILRDNEDPKNELKKKQRKENQVLVSSLLCNIYLKCKKK